MRLAGQQQCGSCRRARFARPFQCGSCMFARFAREIAVRILPSGMKEAEQPGQCLAMPFPSRCPLVAFLEFPCPRLAHTLHPAHAQLFHGPRICSDTRSPRVGLPADVRRGRPRTAHRPGPYLAEAGPFSKPRVLTAEPNMSTPFRCKQSLIYSYLCHALKKFVIHI